MAKGFNEKEKQAIKAKLMDAAEECWGKYGLKKTSVDQLVSMANISKGAFYLFYPTKEHLFMDVFEGIDIRVKAEIFRTVQNSRGSKKDIFISVILQMYEEVKKTPWILNMQNGDFELLVRKLPPERVEEHQKKDDDAAAQLFKLMGMEATVDIDTLSGTLRALFLMLLHKQEIGEGNFDNVIRYMVEAIALKLFQGVKGI